ncbi:MAG: phenylacetate-CoA oxygenase subunit PaaJ [Gammaproteobacteria bacterium]|nr:phenylacetate-CoA oxygenase subunit PaaJ [Gammaproteobacteria bacterium]NNF61321.1 phenylacetate-CoA oxygenase subunit PaaJ [Gammaproteobacteria bacterium]NNM20766.1 phenylacetate-CoA oxygenase subunit PaaJ [Gammaproteobacteria bacterium]
MSAAANAGEQRIWQLLADVPDPEIPVLSVVDLGIVRWVRADEPQVTVGVAPTYTGCPATEVIAASIVAHLRQHGIEPQIEPVLSPPWTTDWISAAGREKLAQYGIAPPAGSSKAALTGEDLAIACPRCESTTTSKVSEFGSTPCKASYKCGDCLEPFEYFKCI